MKLKLNFFSIFFFIIFLICILFYFNPFALNSNIGYTMTSKIDINTEQDVYIDSVCVKNGEKVNRGDVLMILRSIPIEHLNSEIKINLKNIEKINNLESSNINANILKLRGEKNQKISQLTSELKKAEEEFNFQKKIFSSENKSVEFKSRSILIETLKEQIKTTENEYNKLINENIKILNLPKQVSIDEELYKQQYKNNLDNVNKLKIVAPFDGIVNLLHVYKGQFVSKHGILLSFSELMPSNTVVFIHERKHLDFNVGDSVLIISRYNFNKRMKGTIFSIGNKFVLMPQKITESPGIEFFGREIYVKNSFNNSFLDNESIILKKM